MSTNLTKKSRTDSKKSLFRTTTVTPAAKSRASSSSSTFEQVYSQLIHRKDNHFSPFDSPNLVQQLQQLSSSHCQEDPYRSALSTPPPKTIISLDRKRYFQLKQKIQSAMKDCQDCHYTSLKDLFTSRQALLTDFLNDFTAELDKECKEKADILKYLWNSSQNLLQTISQALTCSAKEKEKNELENNLRSHLEYQGLLQGYQKKQVILNEKSNMERVTIHKLVYELRFKRKQINKLYRNQRLLINRLNEYKSQNLHLQSSYIDLMCSLRDVAPQKVQLLLQAKQQIRKSQQISFKINANRKRAKDQIKAQLSNEKIEELESLYEEIKEIANSEANSPHIISTLIQASIENFGIKNDDAFGQEHIIGTIPHKQTKVNAETQISQSYIHDKNKSNEITQFGYLERLKLELINHKDTQTYCQYPKKKLLITVPSQVQPFQLAALNVGEKFAITRACQETIRCQSPSITTLKVITHSASRLEKRHKKNNSDMNPRKSFQKLSSNQLDDFIEEKDDMSSCSQDSVDETSHMGVKINNRRISKANKSSGRMLNMHANSPKQRFTSILSNSSIKVLNSYTNLDSDLHGKKSNFAPFTPSISPNQPVPTSPPPTSPPPTLPTPILTSQYKTQLRKARSSMNTRESIRKSVIPKFKKTQQDFSRQNFLQKNNYFNIQIDAAKQEEINNMFNNNDYTQVEPDSEDEELKRQLQNQKAAQQQNLEKIKSAELNFLNDAQEQAKQKNNRKNSGVSVAKSMRSKRPSSSMKYGDQNELLLNLCRVSYYKGHRRLKQKIALYMYHDQFTNVRDKIEFVARDVKELVVHREALLKKTINSKNLKNTYKILMMTFTKAYDAYNKGVLKGNLIYPLFESFALLYGAINNNEIYKKMVNFIAALAISRQNAILRFFLFFLGLDSASPYSEKVTVSQVYLCLKLLEKISVDGKVTLNIQSIYTDTTRIKQQLMLILKEEKIPPTLSEAIRSRVAKELENSCLYKNSSGQNSHLKLNIYNIILLVIQEVIKCKNALRETFMPLLERYDEFKTTRKLPIYIVEVLLSDWKADMFDPLRLKALLDVITKNGKRQTVTVEQFCSILFQCSLVSIDQLCQHSQFLYRRSWKIPILYLQEIQSKFKKREYASILQQREIEMFFKISEKGEENPTIEKMKRIIFEKHYERKIQAILGDKLQSFLVPDIKDTILEDK